MLRMVTHHRRRARRRWVFAGLALLTCLGAGLGGGVIAGSVGVDRLDDAARASSLRADVAVRVERTPVSRQIRPGFVGLSVEYPAVTMYAGSDPTAINPVFAQLVRNLAPKQRPVLRIGGDTTERTWWPVSRVKPRGVRYGISARWLAVTRVLANVPGPSSSWV